MTIGSPNVDQIEGWLAMGPSDLGTGVLYRDDCLDRLASLPSDSVDMVYLDPPFFSNRTYEVIWGEEAEVRSLLITTRR